MRRLTARSARAKRDRIARRIPYAAQMSDNASKAVLITGCSSGIGEATAQRLAGHGWKVYASARRPESIEHLADAGCELLQLDVCDEQSMRAAVQRIESEHGAVGVLVNNAGYSQGGPVEQVPMEAVRRQFETNVFGLIALTQLVLPGMRKQHWGKVVNVGSMGGRLTLPGSGLYHATKHALEAISDALRFEVRGFGVDVVLIEPGLITTEFGKTAAATVGEAGSDGRKDDARAGADASAGEAEDVGDPYERFNTKLAAMTVGVYEGPMRHLGGGPDVVAKAIEKAISRRKAPSRMLLTPSAHLTVLQRKLLPDRLWDAMLRTQMPEPR
jgi:NADP-dependent 3-hydroxy acid dehydrogenase YdfG